MVESGNTSPKGLHVKDRTGMTKTWNTAILEKAGATQTLRAIEIPLSSQPFSSYGPFLSPLINDFCFYPYPCVPSQFPCSRMEDPGNTMGTLQSLVYDYSTLTFFSLFAK